MQFMHDPSLAAYEAGLYVLAYLLGAKDVGLTFNKHETEILAYSDASWLERGAYPIRWARGFLWGAAVSYSARKVKIVPQSSAEADTAAYSKAAKDLRYVTNVIGAGGFHLKLCTACHYQVRQPGRRLVNQERWLHAAQQALRALVP